MTSTGDISERLGAAVDYLEAHLHQEVRLEEAARRAAFSPWHFIRVFQAARGITPFEYIRRRRLSRAAAALAEGQEVLRVAVEWGYGSQATFTRAFSRAFGVPPSTYRRRAQQADAVLAITPPFEPRLPWKVEPPPTPRYVDRGESCWMGVGVRRSNRRFRSFVDLPATWADWLAHERWRAVEGIDPEDRGQGLTRLHPDGDLEHVIGVEVRPDTAAPRGFRAIRIPPTRYAVFEAVGEPARTVQSLVLSIYSRWNPELLDGRSAGEWDIDRYAPEPEAPPGLLRCELWLPLRRERAGA